MKYLIKVLTVAIIVSSQLCHAQLIVDLADSKTSSESIEANDIKFILFKNLVPKHRKNNKYDFKIEMKQEEIPAFSLKDLEKGEGFTPSCVALEISHKKLDDAESEDVVNQLTSKLQKEIDEANPSDCKDAIDQANALLAQTTYSKLLNFKISHNQVITVTIRRFGDKDTLIWKRTFKTPVKSPWKLMYGFTFTSNVLNPNTPYYSRKIGSDTFQITPLNNQKGGFWGGFFDNISPTVVFHYTYPIKYSIRNNWRAIFSNNVYQVGCIGGLSLNFATETSGVNLIFGPSLLIADNLSLSGGLAMTRKYVLRGEYMNEQILTENLDLDQLHTKKYMLECFISLNFRFESNPFSKE